MHDPVGAEPFKVNVPEADLTDLRERLGKIRWPIEAKAPAWTYGASLAFMKDICAYWRDKYDWRKSEARLNTWPQFKVTLGGKKVHFIMEKGSGPDPQPLIVTHGWPGSVVEFLDIIDPLAHPERYGGDAKDAFTVIVPSIPGYGFSDPPDAPIPPRDVAKLWHELMTKVLGCKKYFAQGGDWGGIITSWLAFDYPDDLIAIHCNIVGLFPDIGDDNPMDAEEAAWNERNLARRAKEIAYHGMNGTKPQTVAYGLQDSPSGCAAYILEKFHGWTTPGEDIKELPFNKDHLLANVMIFWLYGSNAPAWLYVSFIKDPKSRVLPKGKRVEVPTAMLLFPKDIAVPAPSQYIKRSYNLVQRHDAPTGGHFAAFENGPLFIKDVREFFRKYR
jgi:pimeloyl-ACP methyl ester carboxylesterase